MKRRSGVCKWRQGKVLFLPACALLDGMNSGLRHGFHPNSHPAYDVFAFLSGRDSPPLWQISSKALNLTRLTARVHVAFCGGVISSK